MGKDVFFAAICAVLLGSCHAGNDYDKEGLEHSRQAWQAVLDTLPAGADFKEFIRWQQQNGLDLGQGMKQADGNTDYHSSNLPDGYFPVQQHWYSFRVCDGWFLSMDIRLNATQHVKDKELSVRGSCL